MLSKGSRIAMALAMGVSLTVSAAFAAERIERGNLVTENVPEVPADVRERLRQYQNVRGAGFADWTPDSENLLIRTRFGDTSQFHLVEAPLGMRRQLTFYDEPVSGGDFAPPGGPDGFLFRKDTGGDETFRLHFFDAETSEVRVLSDEGVRIESYGWSHDGSMMMWVEASNETATRKVMVAPSDDPSDGRQIFEGEGYWFPVEVSKDNSKVILFNYVSITDNSLHLLDMESGEVTEINPSDEPIAYNGPIALSNDAKTLFFSSDEDSEFTRLVRYDLESGEKTVLTPDIDWNVQGGEMSPDGRLLAFTTNEGGLSKLYIRRVRNNRDLPVPDLPTGIIGGVSFSPDSEKVAFVLNGASMPSDVWVYDIGARDLTRWTQGEVGGLDTNAFIEPELIQYPTFDEVDGEPRQIPAFVYKPAGEGPHPVLVSIHGGPESQYRPGFSSTYQYWLNELGIAVIAPNVRGSSGYGKTYVQLDNGMKREESVKDIGALLDWIATQNDLDADRVVVYGGSYGGYMVLASMVDYADRLAGGIDIVGISNFVTFLENTSEYRRDARRAEYGDERDPEMRAYLEEISPNNNVEKITSPLFIIQGANDPRVPLSESEQMLEAVKKNGGVVWYLMAKDEGHGFRKKSNRDYLSESVSLFLEDILLKDD